MTSVFVLQEGLSKEIAYYIRRDLESDREEEGADTK